VIAVETACGASLALACEDSRALAGFSRVLFIVCGGATATIDQIREWSPKAAAGPRGPIIAGLSSYPADEKADT